MIFKKFINEMCASKKVKNTIEALEFKRKNTVILDKKNAYNIYKIRAHLKISSNKKGLYGIEDLVDNISRYNDKKIKVIYFNATSIQILIFSDLEENVIIGYISNVSVR